MIFVLLPLILVSMFFLERVFFKKNWKKGLKVTITFSEECIRKGEDVFVEEKSENAKRIPLPFISVKWGLERLYAPFLIDGKSLVYSSSFSLPGMRSVKRKKKIDNLKRGIYTINNGVVASSDLFSYDQYSFPLYPGSVLYVTPARRDSLSSSYAYRGFIGTILSKRMNQDDPFEIKAIRPYLPTDSMRSINWKASAKTGSLKVNQYEWTTDESVLVIADLSSGEEEEREILLEYISSFSSLLLERGVSLSFVTNGRNAMDGGSVFVAEGSGSGHINTIDRALATIKLSSSDGYDLSTFLSQKIKGELKNVPVLFSVSPSKEEKETFFSLSKGEGAIFVLKGKEEKNVFLLGESE